MAPDIPFVMARRSRLFPSPASRYHIEQEWMADIWPDAEAEGPGTGDQATWSFEVVDRAFDRRRMSLDAVAGFLGLAAR